MANVLYLVHKMKFDYLFGTYLRQFHHVGFVASDPMIGLFLNCQQENVGCLYEVEPSVDDEQDDPFMQHILNQTSVYFLSEKEGEKQALYALCVRYVAFLREYIANNEINLVITSARQFLDISCITAVADELNLPVCYLASSFFRGDSCGLSFEPQKPYSPDVWSERFRTREHRPLIPLRFVQQTDTPFASMKRKRFVRSLWQKVRYRYNPLWLAKHPDARAKGYLFVDLKETFTKWGCCTMANELSVVLPHEFVFLPLQGDEVFKAVGYPLALSDMEQFVESVAMGVQEANKNRNSTLKLVVKEHPTGPRVLSCGFKKRNPEIVFLKKYPIGDLLEAAQLVITFNSLAGFEALQRNKPVITFAPFFYTLPQLVFRCNDFALLPDLIGEALANGCDQQAVDDFTSFVKTHFEVSCPGFERSTAGVEVFQKIHERIAGFLDYARTHQACPSSWSKMG